MRRHFCFSRHHRGTSCKSLFFRVLLAFDVSVPISVSNMFLARHTRGVVYNTPLVFGNHSAGIDPVLASAVGMAATAKVGDPIRVAADTGSAKWAVKNLGFASYLVKVFL